MSLADVGFPDGREAARQVARYREWWDLVPVFGTRASDAQGRRPPKATGDDIDLSRPVELVMLAVKEGATRTRRLGSDQVLTLRTSGLWEVVRGDIATIHPRRQWRYAGHPYLSGDIADVRLDVGALGLVPLRLKPTGPSCAASTAMGSASGVSARWTRRHASSTECSG